MRFYTNTHKHYCGIDLHARAKLGASGKSKRSAHMTLDSTCDDRNHTYGPNRRQHAEPRIEHPNSTRQTPVRNTNYDPKYDRDRIGDHVRPIQ
jgi:hypothetical protein